MAALFLCPTVWNNQTMSEKKKDELDRITLKSDVLRQYFPREYTPIQIQNTIIKLLEAWQRTRQREKERWMWKEYKIENNNLIIFENP